MSKTRPCSFSGKGQVYHKSKNRFQRYCIRASKALMLELSYILLIILFWFCMKRPWTSIFWKSQTRESSDKFTCELATSGGKTVAWPCYFYFHFILFSIFARLGSNKCWKSLGWLYKAMKSLLLAGFYCYQKCFIIFTETDQIK